MLTYARALVAGDELAFRRLVEQGATPVLRICFRIMGSVEEAEDAAQEAFVLAYRARGSYRGDGSPDAWLARIATREACKRRDAATLPLDPALLELLPHEGIPCATSWSPSAVRPCGTPWPGSRSRTARWSRSGTLPTSPRRPSRRSRGGQRARCARS